MVRDPNTVQIFDTTLRDGEQSLGATMSVEEKVLIARQLETVGVDVIEAGFAAFSEGDFARIARVAESVSRPIVLSLARAREADVALAVKSVAKAKSPGIHIFIGTSDLYMKRKLSLGRQEVIDRACATVRYAKQYVDYVQFSADDASRSDRDYLSQVFGEVIKCGAVTLNVPDTLGYAVPDEVAELFRHLLDSTSGAETVRWSVHCHNDLGMALANSLAAVRAGARQVECTINGIGGRAGNTSLEEVVLALRTRKDFYRVRTNIVPEHAFKRPNDSRVGDEKPRPNRQEPEPGMFRMEGDYWTIAFDGAVLRFRDSKGLQYVANLLRSPGQEWHVLDLIGLRGSAWNTRQLEPRALRPEAPDPTLDPQSKAAYKRRLTDLREELSEAERFNDAGRAAKARDEMEFITHELSAAVGLGGRDRKTGAPVERARLLVTQRIKATLKKIRDNHPVLGRHLATNIKTGYFCMYTPDLDHPVKWLVGVVLAIVCQALLDDSTVGLLGLGDW